MDYKQMLVDAGKKMLHSGLTVETWGNISLRDTDTGLAYLTPSALPYDIMTTDDVVVARVADGQIVEGTRKPTIETGLHLGIYRDRSDVKAIVHTHPIYSQIFAALHEDIPPVIDEAAQIMGSGVKVAQYALPGSEALAENCIAALGSEGHACLLANHGAVCVGGDIDFAFKVATVLEMTAQIYYMSRSIGEPKLLTDEQIAFMHDFAYNHYGQGK